MRPFRRHLALVAAGQLLLALPATRADAQGLTLSRSRAAGGVSLVHEAWSIADGLPVNSINHLIQTRDGYLWAATFDGLVRFDGVRFTVFNSANTPGLPSDRFVRLYEGIADDLWIVTEQRHIIRMRRGQFTVIATPLMTPPEFTSLLPEADGTTWIGTSRGLVRVIGDSLVAVLPDVVRDTVQTLLRRRDGALLVGMARDGLVSVRRQPDGAFIGQHLTFDTVPASRGVTALFEDARGALWVGSGGRMWTGTRTLRSLAMPPAFKRARFATRFLPAPDGAGVLVYAEGVYRADSTRVTIVDSTAADYYNAPLWTDGRAMWYARGSTIVRSGVPLLSLGSDGRTSAFNITTALKDREGSIWLGTFAGGLHRLKPTLFTTYSVDEGVRDRNTLGVYADSRGGIWVGSWENGFSLIDPKSGAIRGFGSREQPPYIARTFLEGRDGTLWIGGGDAPAPLFRCQREPTLRCTPERPQTGVMMEVSALHEDVDGRLWAGARNGLFRRDAGKWTRLEPSTGAPRVPVRAFAVTRDGALWMGTNGGGVVRYREGTFTTITSADGLPSDAIRSLYTDVDGWLWIGTEGRGLARLDPRAWGDGATNKRPGGRRIAAISVREGLFDNVIHQILEDDNQRLWMNTNRGVFWITRAEANAVADGLATRVHSTGYTERDGMRNREGNGGVQPAGAKGSDGRLWFPTQDGVVMVDPRTVRPDTLSPQLVIEQVMVGSTAIRPSEGRVRLSPTQRDARIEFTALTFLEPRNVRFRYRLERYDKDWVDGENRRSAFYTQLPPGTYTFRVQARGAGADWNERSAMLTLVVAPRYFERTSFKFAVIAALAAAILVVVRRRTSDSRERAEQLERLVVDRTTTLREREHLLATQNQQLEAQAAQLQQLDTARSRFLANVSHELRTPLTLTIGPLEDLRSRTTGDPRAARWLEIAIRNSRRLLSLVNQILDVAKLEAGAMHLAPRPFDLAAFLRGIGGSFQPVVERKRVQLLLDLPAQCPVTMDPDAIEKIATNLLSNAVKFTPPDGRIALTLSSDSASVILAVQNSGPPIPADRLVHLFERFYQVDESNTTVQPGTGIGLSLVKELVELQRGTVDVTSDQFGTTFTVTLALADADRPDARALTDPADPLTPETAEGAGIPDGEDRELELPTLLIVDDSEDLRSYIREHFADRFHVIEAGDGVAGLALAREHLPDVIVSDVMMPEMDGRELVQALRASHETDFLAVLLLTAQAEDEQKISGLEGGADDYLVKPFEMRELDVRVRNILAARRRLQARFGGEALAAGISPPIDGIIAPYTNAAAVAGVDRPPQLSADDEAYRERVFSAARAGLADADFGVGELARDVFQDRSHLFRRVRQVIGMAPSELLRGMRVDEAARLLATGTGTVANVAYSVGFKSVSHFCRCFQDRFGVTPATYRASPPRASFAKL